VREWLKGLEAEDRKVIGEDIKDVEFSWPIGMPLVGSLGRELWEVRSRLPRGRIARVFFAWSKGVWCCFTASSRRLKRPRNTTCIWHLNGEREQAHEKEKHRVILR
jgi:hypothetical protein